MNQRLAEKEKKKALRAQAKLHETEEEKRARRKEKKQKKEQSHKDLQEQSYFGYSNENNRFGDSDLMTPFVWKKKLVKQHPKLSGSNLRKVVNKTLRKKQARLQQEITKIKEDREKREEEKMAQDQLREDMARQLEQENFEDLNIKEEKFHRDQAVLRSRMRIREGREKPIDTLAKNVILFSANNKESSDPTQVPDEDGNFKEAVDLEFDLELTEPYQILIGLDLEELETLRKEIDTHLELGANLDYWENLVIVVEDEINRFKQQSSVSRSTLHKSVENQVDAMFSSKSFSQLGVMQKEIEARVASGGDETTGAVDPEYWQNLLTRLKVFKAKAFLGEMHKEMLNRRLSQLQEKQNKKRHPTPRASKGDESDTNADTEMEDAEPSQDSDKEVEKREPIEGLDEDDDLMDLLTTPNSNADACEEPELVSAADDEYRELARLAIDPNEFYEALAEARMRVLTSRIDREKRREKITFGTTTSDQSYLTQSSEVNRAGGNTLTADQMYEREAKKASEAGEETFNSATVVVDDVSQDPYWWQDKYRPRKPRFFNRVKTGYDWNKYNQVHYDHDNPPPKIVQGYKFNVFYPDLIDPSKTPEFEMKALPDNPDYAILKFTAGPPYEDIAFKIVNKEWEDNPRRGFKCRFERGVMQLYFNFRRFRYRR